MDYPFSQLLMVVQCQRPSAILNHQDFPLRTFAIKRHWHQAKKLLEEASRQQLMLRFGTLITCAIARCRNHQLEHFPNSAATLWYNRTNYSGDMIPLYLLKMLDSKNDELNSPESIADLLSASDKSSVTAWTSSAGCIMLKPSHLGASISLLQCPFFHLFSASQSLKIQISPSFFFGGVGSKRVSSGFPGLPPHPTPLRHLRPEKCGGSGKLMKTCDLRCASDLFSARWVPYFPIFLATHLSVVLVFFSLVVPLARSG